MKETMKGAAGVATVGVNQVSWQGGLALLNTRFGWNLSDLECIAIAGGLATFAHVLAKYGRPVAAALYRRLLVAVGAAVVVLGLGSSASASPTRVVLECAKFEAQYHEATDEIVDVCARPRLYLDLAVQFGGLAFNLDRPRDVLAGFAAGSGYGFRWLPDFWTLSEAFLSVDVFVQGGLDLQADGPDAVMVGLSGLLTFANIIGAGVGYLWEIGFGDRPDKRTFVGLLVAVTSF